MGLKRGRGTDSVDGNKLYRKSIGAANLTPQKFRRQLKTVTLREGVQVDYSFPTALNGDRVYVDLNQNDQQYEGATLTTIDEILLTGNDLISYKRTNDAQTETINERLVEETDSPPPLSALVTTMDQEAIGDGKSLLRYGVVGYVFPNQRWEANRATLIPAEFSFLVPEQSYTFTEAGVAGPIPVPLPLGTTSLSDEQIDVYRHRMKTGVQDFFAPGVLPITITGSRTTKDKQVEHIEKTLQLAAVVPEPPTALLDVTWQNLGNGAAIEEHDFVDNLFTQQTYEAEIADVVPHRFKALVPVKTSASVTEGTASDPTLVSGDLKRTSEQVNVFVVKNTRQYRDTTALPVEQFDFKITPKLQVSTVANRLASIVDPGQVLVPDHTWLNGDVQDLGNLTSLRTKETVAPGDFFEERSYEGSIPDLIPEKFRPLALLRKESLLIPGTAAPPPDPLPTGYLSVQSEQTNAFVTRYSSTRRSIVGTPSLTEYELTREKKVSTVVATLANFIQTITGVDELTDKAEVDNLGNGSSIKIVGRVSDLFEAESFGKTIPDNVPEKFRVIVPTRRHELLEAGTSADDRDLVTGELAYTSEQVNAFVVRQTSTTRNVVGTPSLTEYEMTREKQISTVVATLATGLQTLTGQIDELTDKAQVDNLGGNLSLKILGAVPVLFTAESFGKQIPDPIPEKFRVIVPTRRHEILVADTSANDRALITGELSYTSERVNAFVVRETSTARSVVSSVTLPGYRMTAQGQVADVVATLAPGLQTITPDFHFIEAEVDNLGNGTSLKTESTVADVFPDDSYTVSILNLIPEKLRAAIKMRETSVDSKIPPDISTSPTLLTGELERTEKRLGVFKKRIMIKSLGTIPGGGVTVTDKGFTEQNGGDTTTTTHTLNTHGSLPVEVDRFVLKCDVIDLGNGYDVRSTERADNTTNWPTLNGQEYDERLDVVLPFTTRTRLAGTDLGTARMDIKPRDQWKQDERQVDLTAVGIVLGAYVMSYPSKVNIDMPDRLVGVQGIIEKAFGQGSNSETGGNGPNIGSFSISMALRASAQSSASLIPDATPDVVQFWGNQIDCLHYHFFLPNPVTPAAVLAKITSLVGAVSNWPKFAPKSVTIVARGEKASAQATASSQGSYSISNSGQSSTTAGGTGSSQEHAVNLKTIRIPPTIHSSIDIAAPTDGNPYTRFIHVTAHANAAGLGVDSTSTPPDDSVTAQIYVGTPGNTNIAATAGDTVYPTTGKYVFRIDAQPYRYGYVQFHVIIVDAANFPPS